MATSSSDYPGLDDVESAALESAAQAIVTDPQYLWEVMNFESRLNPQATGAKLSDGSHARGLIQFMPATAKGLGFASADDLVTQFPDFTTQVLGPVTEYFQKLGGDLSTRQGLYMNVFFPIAAKLPGTTTFQSIYASNPSLGSYATFASENPGILTIDDYVNKTMAAAQGKWTYKTVKTVAVTGGATAGLLVLGLAAWFFFLRSPRRRSTR